MFCPNCGAKAAEGSARCSQCGEVFGATGVKTDGGAVKGFFILIASFFMMPVKTLKLTAQQLRELGGKGSLDTDATEIPHLTWLGVAGHFFASFVVVLIIIVGVAKGLLSLKAFEDSAKEAIGGLILSPILGVIAAIAANWLIMIWLELLLLLVNIANDIKKIANKG